jgi:cytochrome oxidase Cu insertion factor (SCO1/SenC/PrrC family)
MSDVASEVLAPARKRRIRGEIVLVGMLGVVAIAIAVLVFAYKTREIDPELPDLGTVPAFSLIDESGATFTEEALRGHPTVINFVFTRCDTICPVIAMKTQRLQDRTLDRKGIAIKILTISVDPEYDTPARLTEFGARYSQNATKWRLVTGPKDKITALVTGPLMNTMDREGNMPSGAPQIVHSGYFLLVDGNLTVRGVYDSNDIHKLDELERHARFLARTAGDDAFKFGGS